MKYGIFPAGKNLILCVRPPEALELRLITFITGGSPYKVLLKNRSPTTQWGASDGLCPQDVLCTVLSGPAVCSEYTFPTYARAKIPASYTYKVAGVLDSNSIKHSEKTPIAAGNKVFYIGSVVGPGFIWSEFGLVRLRFGRGQFHRAG